ncbi:MAG: L-ribulose-5-phosphate 4-epimerase AraD [Bacilli bacterium]|nr:L-ribulose-5-phosphate 4-epimerase AraD [Bacilli bacterium]
MLEELKRRVYQANLALVKAGLVILTWGNVSEKDDETGYIVIKPSGVLYDKMKESDMVVVDLNGKVIEGNLNPSSDTPTHIEMYKAHPGIKAIVHTHSFHATARSQSGLPLPCYGTTHADSFKGEVPVTRKLTKEEVENDYEKNTGKVINECLTGVKDIYACPGIFVNNHGPFTWGENAFKAVENALILEYICALAMESKAINPHLGEIDKFLEDKHYYRKHGKDKYYGQKEER